MQKERVFLTKLLASAFAVSLQLVDRKENNKTFYRQTRAPLIFLEKEEVFYVERQLHFKCVK